MIFPPASPIGRVYRFLKRGTRTVYDSATLENELLRIFGDTTFGEARTAQRRAERGSAARVCRSSGGGITRTSPERREKTQESTPASNTRAGQ